MRIVILGAGTVGSSVARTLYQHRHNVIIIEKNPDVVRHLQDTTDALIIEGSVSHAATLFKADIMNADLCLAMTDSDETNILSASLAKAMGARRVIARVFSPMFHNFSTFDYRRYFKIDRILSLEQLSALRMAREIDQYMGILTFDSVSCGNIVLMEYEISPASQSVGKRIRDLRFPSGVRIGTIRREGKNMIVSADDVLQVGDHLAMIGEQGLLTRLRKSLDIKKPEPRDVIIAGGGETGYHLAQMLQKTHRIRLIDADLSRCRTLGAMLDKKVEILNADVQKRFVLEEYARNTDFFIACTGYDENNLLACVEAKALGADQVFSIINRSDYGNVVKKLGIDFYVSPREEAAQEVMNFLNTGAVIFNNGVMGSGIRLVEIEVQQGAPIVNVALMNAKLPRQSIVLAATHEGSICVPGAEYRFSAGDTAILIMHDRDVDDVLSKFEPA
ncbi:MAG: Trk system potassium transporter TrkA [Planctomycetia bacterium]|nr:Trk system potassium transporter TrkA [Planctomycetia bacterium]